LVSNAWALALKNDTMKKQFLIAVCLLGLNLCALAQKTSTEKKQPKAVYKEGSVRITEWENMDKNGEPWTNYKIENIYKKGEEWKSSNNYNTEDLLQLRALIDSAIANQGIQPRAKGPKGDKGEKGEK
jgi:hypothetical protein